jgi:hypothetical protein
MLKTTTPPFDHVLDRKDAPCSHVWIDPTEPPIARAAYAPIIGPLRRQMKPGDAYRCRNCLTTLSIPAAP